MLEVLILALTVRSRGLPILVDSKIPRITYSRYISDTEVRAVSVCLPVSNMVVDSRSAPDKDHDRALAVAIHKPPSGFK